MSVVDHGSGSRSRQEAAVDRAEIPLATTLPVDTSPISLTPPSGVDLDPLWAAVVNDTRVRSNDIHLPMSLAYAERLCAAYPQADALVVRVAILLHDTGWARVDEDRIISEGFRGDWRRAAIRYEHERQGCAIAREVLPPLGYEPALVDAVTAIIDGHDTRPDAKSLEDALVRDADRLWRFEHAGVALASGWFGLNPAEYCERVREIVLPELQTAAAVAIATADLERSEQLLKTGVLR